MWPWSPWLGGSSARSGGLDEPRLDAELAEPQPIVGAELDRGPRGERDPLAAGVLEQVARQLALELVLVALELLAVVGREPDRVLVRGVDARQRLDAVLVHLARQLARDLDRAHLGPEGTRERAFDEAGELGFEGSQHAHGRLERWIPVRRAVMFGDQSIPRPCADHRQHARHDRAGGQPARLGEAGAAGHGGGPGGQRGGPGGGADDVERERAAAHEPRQHDRGGRPQRREQQHAGGRERLEHLAGARPAPCRRRARDRAAARRAAATTGRRRRAPRAPTRRARGPPRRGRRPPARPGRARARPPAATTSSPRRRSSSGGTTAAAATSAAASGHGPASAATQPAAAISQPTRGKSATSRNAADRARERRDESSPVAAPALARPAASAAAPGPRRAQRRRRRGPAAAAGGRALERVRGDRAAVVGDLRQRVGERVGQLVERAARLGIGRQRAVERRAQLRRQVAPARAQRRQHGADQPRGRRRARPAHRVGAGQRLVEHERERVEVGALVDALAGRLLGRHVGERADHVAGAGQRLVAGQVGDAEVGQLGRHVRLVGHDHVLRLDVAVDHAALVGVAERLGEREADAQDVAVAERAVALQHVERAAAHQLGDQVATVAIVAGVVDRHDPRVVEARRGQRLALRALGRRPVGGNQLQRHVPVEPLVVRRVDGPEAARPQPRAEPVAAGDERAARDLGDVHPDPLRRARPGPFRPVPPRGLVLLDPSIWVDQVRRDGAAPRGDELPALSFFDEDDEPRRTPRPRRASPAGGGVATADSQTLLIRRGVALVGGILVLLLLLFFVNSCRDRAARERAEGLQPPALDDRHGLLAAGRRPVLPAARGGRRRPAAGAADGDLGATASRPSSSTSRPSGSTSRATCAARSRRH